MVDPLIGTGQTVDGIATCEKGATMPYVGVPFGSVMWVPMTRKSQFGTLAFNQQDTKLLGFAASRRTLCLRWRRQVENGGRLEYDEDVFCQKQV